MRREELEGPADRTAGPLDWPPPTPARSSSSWPATRRSRARHDPPAPPQADRRDGDTRVELSLDEVDVVSPLSGRRPVRRARGRAGQGRRGRLPARHVFSRRSGLAPAETRSCTRRSGRSRRRSRSAAGGRPMRAAAAGRRRRRLRRAEAARPAGPTSDDRRPGAARTADGGRGSTAGEDAAARVRGCRRGDRRSRAERTDQSVPRSHRGRRPTLGPASLGRGGQPKRRRRESPADAGRA